MIIITFQSFGNKRTLYKIESYIIDADIHLLECMYNCKSSVSGRISSSFQGNEHV